MEKDSFGAQKAICLCRSALGFFITRRQASWMGSVAVLLCLLLFLAGYFWGRRQVATELTDQMVSQFFVDQTHDALNYSYQTPLIVLPTESAQEALRVPAAELENWGVKTTAVRAVTEKKLSLTAAQQYYAELIGFGSRKAAQRFVAKLQNSGYTTYLKQRRSHTSQGKLISWYQVLTERFADKHQLLQLVAKIKRAEHLKDVKIITV